MLSTISMANPSWVATLWWNSQRRRVLDVKYSKTEDLLAVDLEPVGLLGSV
jgi:hypothetical protein